MNTKQVEELTGISRQNIRFYEKIGLLHPGREEGNAYRNYREEDVKRLQFIKLLRMLDMTTEEIAQVFQGNVALEDAVRNQQMVLQQREKQLQGAIAICGRIVREEGKATIWTEKEQNFPVQKYLSQVEYEQNKVGGFAQFKEDYKKIITADQQRQFSFVVPHLVHTDEELIKELERYNQDEGWEIKRQKGGEVNVFKDGRCYVISKKKIRTKQGEVPSTLVMGTMVHPDQAADALIPVRRKSFLYSIHIVMRNIRRHKWKSLLSISVCAMTMLLLAVYFGMMGNLRDQKNQLPQVMPVRASIFSLNGQRSKGLLIKNSLLEQVRTSEYVADYTEQAELFGNVDGEEDTYFPISGVTKVEDLKERVTDLQTEGEVFSIGKAGASEDSCLIEQAFMEEHSLNIGDSVTVQTDYFASSSQNWGSLLQLPLLKVTMRIAGSYRTGELGSDESVPRIYVSVRQIQNWYAQANQEYMASSFSLEVKDPSKLNDFKQQMQDAGLREIDEAADNSFTGAALKVYDGNYIEAATRLERSMDMLQSFYPLVFLITVMIGGIVSYLLLYSRRMEASIMRAMGTRRHQTIVLFMLEHTLLAIVGCVAGELLALALGLQDFVWYMAAVFFLCYLAGALISLEGISKTNISVTLTGRE
ncbi:MAG: MerR family transcriptional regulator [Lachnospiraceae bacterium]|nr:MerR family transcriptional regulator [Lachnospiraceae bacterium]